MNDAYGQWLRCKQVKDSFDDAIRGLRTYALLLETGPIGFINVDSLCDDAIALLGRVKTTYLEHYKQ